MGERDEFAVIKAVHVQICTTKKGGKSACVKDLCYYILCNRNRILNSVFNIASH